MAKTKKLNTFDRIYRILEESIRTNPNIMSVFEVDRVRCGNIVTYADCNGTKDLSSDADYPQVRATISRCTPNGADSAGWHYTVHYNVSVETGVLDYESRMTPMLLELIVIARSFQCQQWKFDNGDVVLGGEHGEITFGKFHPEQGDSPLNCWGFQFSIQFRVSLKQDLRLILQNRG